MRIALLFCFITVMSMLAAGAQTEATKEKELSKKSETYDETVRLLKGVADDQSDSTKALFLLGKGRVEDLVRAEKVESDHDIRVSAGLVLQLLGDSRCNQWNDTDAAQDAHTGTSKGTKPIAICSSKVSESFLARLEKTFAVRSCEKSQSCKEEDYPDIDDSIVSALFIDGSPRAQALLGRMRDLAAASSMNEVMLAEVLADISDFKTATELRKGIAVDDPGLANWIQKNAFFLSEAERDGADVEVLARTPDDSRLLAAVSYRCGPKCGKGYYVVLERSGNTWRYALARLAWLA